MERLKNAREFSAVYNQGKPHFGKYVVISVLPTEQEISRVGFAVGKKVGNAVTRNKIKRRLRAIIQDQSKQIVPGFDLIVGAKRNSVTADFKDLHEDVCRVLGRSDIFDSKRNKPTEVGKEHA